MSVLRFIRPCIQADGPLYPLFQIMNRRHTQRSLQSIRILLAGIHRYALYAYRTRCRNDSQQRVCDFAEDIHRYIQTIVEHGYIRPYRIIQSVLPLKVGISQSRYQNTRTEYIGHPSIELISRESLISGKVLITGIADRRTQLEQLKQVRAAHKLFLVNIPTYTHRPRIAKTVARPEHGSSVAPIVYVEQITVVIRVSTIQIETGRTRGAFGI